MSVSEMKSSSSHNSLLSGSTLDFQLSNLFASGLDFARGIAASDFTSQPVNKDAQMIALGFGLPDPELFSIDDLRDAADKALRTDGLRALQYGGGSGMAQLPEWIRTIQAARRQIPCQPGELVLTHGSSQAMDLIARVFLNPGDEVWFERPTYFGAIKIFGLRGAVERDFPMDEDGLVVDAVQEELARRRRNGEPLPKLFYTIPNYQNPSGRSMTLARRQQLIHLAQQYHFLIVEDDAYGDLGFDGEMLPTLRQLCPSHVLYLNTFSKTIAPGFRVGWIMAPAEAVAKIREVKAEGANGGFVQEVLSRFLESIDYEDHIAHLKAHYQSRRDAMLEALERDFQALCEWTKPSGGFFVWLTLPSTTRLSQMMALSEKMGVSFVPGTAFYVGDGGQNHIRLSFSLYPPEAITEGMKRFKQLIESVQP
ncbi:PLP-dependent aminotransferase family protein [Sulfobacillus thermosulfidooxidans]|uniref:aminotransferase-like domain-containing protein n=1 Tax=Sulfobacillus thermosulfidooxidans TaxID=28034 RepID=UPI0002DDC050|nr:PLP-dependent aminotransferase family protein [Sulfobacillus thermosulfidooxidans]